MHMHAAHTSRKTRAAPPRTFAHSTILRRYIDLGGELFTFGSDSHNADRNYADIERAKDMVRALGGKYQASFAARRMTCWRI